MTVLRLALQILLPLLFLGAGAFGVYWLVENQEEPERTTRVRTFPKVSVETARTVDHATRIVSQGTVVPRAQIDVVPEVAGKVLEVSPHLVDGGAFAKDEVLLRIDPTDFELAVVQREAEVKRAEFLLEQEEAEAAIARREWKELGKGEADPLALREPQLAQARAEVGAARAALRKAKIDLERTVVRAPFPGRVLDENVDVGQFVVAGQSVARIYASDVFEVQLPVDDRQIAFLPKAVHELGQGGDDPLVRMSASLGGEDQIYYGRLVRSSGQIDQRSRLFKLIARLPGLQDQTRPELRVFVPKASAGTVSRIESVFARALEQRAPGHPGSLKLESRTTPEGLALRIELAPGCDVDEARRIVQAELAAHLQDGLEPQDMEDLRVQTETVTPRLAPTPGLFVRAEIGGRVLRGVVGVPRSAMRNGDHVVVIERGSDGYDRLYEREVDVLRSESDVAYVERGLEPGDRFVTSRLEVVVDGMKVHVLGDPDSPESETVEPGAPSKLGTGRASRAAAARARDAAGDSAAGGSGNDRLPATPNGGGPR